MPVSLPPIDLPPLEPRNKDRTVVVMPLKVVYALYIVIGCAIVIMAIQGILLLSLARKLGLL